MISAEFYYCRLSGEEIPASLYDDLRREIGPEKVNEWIEVVTVPQDLKVAL